MHKTLNLLSLKYGTEGLRRTTSGQTRARLPRLYSGPSSIPSSSTFSGGRASSSCASRRAASPSEASSYCIRYAKSIERRRQSYRIYPSTRKAVSSARHFTMYPGQNPPHLTSPACVLMSAALTSRSTCGTSLTFIRGMRTAASRGERPLGMETVCGGGKASRSGMGRRV